MQHLVKQYTVGEFIREGTSPLESGPYQGRTYWHQDGGNAEFYGTGTAQEANRLANFGWPEGTKLVNKLKMAIGHRLGIKNKMLETCHDVVGGFVDVPMYLTGQPNCMVSFEESETNQTGFVHVHLSAGVSGGVSTEEIRLQGATVGALVDALESCNHRVKLTWERSSKMNGHMITLWMVLKDYQDSLDMDRLSFFLCNNAARRPMSWTHYLKLPEEWRSALNVVPGMAACNPASHPSLFTEADIKVSHIHFNDIANATEWIRDQLENLGIEME